MHVKLGRRLALLAGALALPAAAEHPTAETAALSWVREAGAESCPPETDVLRAIEQRLGRSTFVPADRAELVLEAKLTALPAGAFRADLLMRRGSEVIGRRELLGDGPSCQLVAENAALVIALTIDPEASLDPLPIATTPAAAPSPSPPTEQPSRSESRKSAPPSATKSEGDGPAWQGDVEVAAGIATGSVPKLSPGVFARGRAFPPQLPFGIELGAAFFPLQRVDAEPGKGADFSEFAAGAALCSRPSRPSRLRGLVCAGVDAGAVAGRGYGFDENPRFRTLTVGLSARGRLGFRVLPALAVVVGPDVVVPLKRDHFEARTPAGTQQLFRMSPIGIGFELGVVWEL